MKIPKNWTFDNKDVASNFDIHVREQLPWYDLTTSTIKHIARHYIPHKGLVYDLGASTGNIGCALEEILKERDCKLIAIEKEKKMIENYKCKYGTVVEEDIITYSYQKYDLAIAFLTFMFLPPKYIEPTITTLYNNLNVGGAIILFDKTPIDAGYFGLINYRLTLAEKVSTTSASDIVNKELSLQGIQRPLNTKILEKFKAKLFFKFSNFEGYIIEKE